MYPDEHLRKVKVNVFPLASFGGSVRELHKGVILQSASGAPKGGLRESVVPVRWADVDAGRVG